MSDARSEATANSPAWQIESTDSGQRVRLSGSWRLFTTRINRKRLRSDIDELSDPQSMTWDLDEIEAIDSAGIWLIWQLWGQAFPAQLKCRDSLRERFNRLANAPPVPPKKAGHRSLLVPLQKLGNPLIRIGAHTVGLLVLLFNVLVDFSIWTVRWRLICRREIAGSIYRNGVSSLVLLGVTGYVIGVVMSLQIGVTLSSFGANQQIIGLMGLAVTRELGPVIAAIIQVGRAGSSITAGIAGMHLTEELDALKTFGASPRMRLVSARVLAMMITMPLLVVWTDVAEIAGGATTAQFDLNVPFTLFLARLPGSVGMFNYWLGLIKGVLFGLIIALVSSYFGLKAEPNTDSLSAQTTRSVVVGLALILILDALSGAILAKLGYL